MKTVWVNRFNADGSVKTMSEWELWQCNENQTHTYPCHGGGRSFDGGGLPDRNCFITEFGTVRDSGIYFLEYIGDQRGDGWFYIEDGDLPPNSKDIVIVTFTNKAFSSVIAKDVLDPVFRDMFLAWKPIQPPKFLSPQF